MKERPILFSAPMVRAILDGAKTQTRRVVKPQFVMRDGEPIWPSYAKRPRGRGFEDCPYGQPGGRLWVRENFQPLMADDVPESEWLSCDYKTGAGYKVSYPATDGVVEYYDISTDDAFCDRVTPSIHMPRWASRITLEITGVRVERVQEISEADAVAEGVERVVVGDGWRRYDSSSAIELAGLVPCETARASYRSLWEQINGPGSWEANPWVWVIKFKRVTP